MGIFYRRELKKPSVGKPIGRHNLDLDELIEKLIDKEFLNPVGSKKLVCTHEGDTVKHNFNDMVGELQVQGFLRLLSADKVNRIDGVRIALDLFASGEDWSVIRAAIAPATGPALR
jgi:hypothetical protein